MDETLHPDIPGTETFRPQKKKAAGSVCCPAAWPIMATGE
jgi:hypothetical protein